MSPESTQIGCILPAQNIRHFNAGVCHDRIRWVLEPAKKIDLRGIFPEERKAQSAIPVQRNIKKANGVLQVHEAKGGKIGTRKQIIGEFRVKKTVPTRRHIIYILCRHNSTDFRGNA